MQPATVWKESPIVSCKNNTKILDRNYGTTEKLIHLLGCGEVRTVAKYGAEMRTAYAIYLYTQIVREVNYYIPEKVFSQYL